MLGVLTGTVVPHIDTAVNPTGRDSSLQIDEHSANLEPDEVAKGEVATTVKGPGDAVSGGVCISPSEGGNVLSRMR